MTSACCHSIAISCSYLYFGRPLESQQPWLSLELHGAGQTKWSPQCFMRCCDHHQSTWQSTFFAILVLCGHLCPLDDIICAGYPRSLSTSCAAQLRQNWGSPPSSHQRENAASAADSPEIYGAVTGDDPLCSPILGMSEFLLDSRPQNVNDASSASHASASSAQLDMRHLDRLLAQQIL